MAVSWLKTHRGTVALAAGVLAVLAIFASVALRQKTRPASAAFPPGQNGKIAVQYQAHIYTIDPDGSNLTQLTSGSANEASPAWSPDGRKIAYVSRAGSGSQGDIYVMNADGSSPTQLTSSADDDITPAWSPDGSKIAFARGSCTFCDHTIYIMNSDGSGQTQLATAYGEAPKFSPDGTRIAYDGLPPNHQIFVMNVDGSHNTQLTFFQGESSISPDWSPDGTKIAFQNTTGDQDVFVMNSDGTNQVDVSNNPGTFDAKPVWSPDGYKIAFLRVDNSSAGLAVMNSDGSGVSFVASGVAPSSWQRVAGPTPTPTPCPTEGCPTNTPTPTPTITPTPCPAPGCGLDFSIGTDLASGAGGTCDSSGTPTAKCSVPLDGKFKVSFYLNSLPSFATTGPSGYDADIQYTGMTFDAQSTQSVNQTYWPPCAKSASKPSDQQIHLACGTDTGGETTPYVGRMATIEFTCAAGGAVTLQHGIGRTDVAYDFGTYAEAEGTSESLTINCVSPQAYPGDTDGDGCPDSKETGLSALTGGLRNFLNPWDYFNPTHDGQNRVDDILAVVQHYGRNQGDAGYSTDYDRTYLGPNPWNLGPPNGQIRVDDILNIIHQYGHDCS